MYNHVLTKFPVVFHKVQPQWCSRKYLGTVAVQNISMVLFLEREHQNAIT